jgi:hypothetical protein
MLRHADNMEIERRGVYDLPATMTFHEPESP